MNSKDLKEIFFTGSKVALTDPNLMPVDFRLYCYLSCLEDKFISRSDITKGLPISVSTISRSIKRLLANNYISRTRIDARFPYTYSVIVKDKI